jgi:hypothetical protein
MHDAVPCSGRTLVLRTQMSYIDVVLFLVEIIRLNICRRSYFNRDTTLLSYDCSLGLNSCEISWISILFFNTLHKSQLYLKDWRNSSAVGTWQFGIVVPAALLFVQSMNERMTYLCLENCNSNTTRKRESPAYSHLPQPLN